MDKALPQRKSVMPYHFHAIVKVSEPIAQNEADTARRVQKHIMKGEPTITSEEVDMNSTWFSDKVCLVRKPS